MQPANPSSPISPLTPTSGRPNLLSSWVGVLSVCPEPLPRQPNLDLLLLRWAAPTWRCPSSHEVSGSKECGHLLSQHFTGQVLPRPWWLRRQSSRHPQHFVRRQHRPASVSCGEGCRGGGALRGMVWSWMRCLDN